MTETKSDPKNGERLGECAVIIEKGKTTDVRVQIASFEGHRYLDVRMFFVADATSRAPSPKGCTLPLHRIPELRAALEKAEARAIELGLLEHEPEPTEAAAA